MKNEITLTLNVEEANVVLGALSKMPFETVSELISNITKQAQSQLDNANSTEAVEVIEE